MAGKSTSSGAVLHGNKTKESCDFDLQSWQGLTAVLKVAKESIANPSEYSNFRNLVLKYAQQGGDPEIKTLILDKLAGFSCVEDTVADFNSVVTVPLTKPSIGHEIPRLAQTEAVDSVSKNVVPATVPEIVVPTPSRRLNVTSNVESKSEVSEREIEKVVPVASIRPTPTRRLRPQFGVPTTEVSVSSAVEEVVAAEQSSKEDAVQPSQDMSEVVAVELSEDPIVEIAQQESAVPSNDFQVETAQNPATEVSLFQTAPATRSIEEHKIRIAEIKKAVLDQFGNPAALVSSLNEVGVTYMKALLTAIKAAAAGNEQNLEGAMVQLESVFSILNDPSVREAIKETVAETVPELDAALVAAVESESLPEVMASELSTVEAEESNVVPEEVSTELPFEESTAPEVVVSEVTEFEGEQLEESAPESGYGAANRDADSLADLSSTKPRNDYLTESILQDRSRISNTTSARGKAAQNKYTLRGIAKTENSLAKTDVAVDVTEVKEVIVRQSELVSEEITSSLRKLIHDWNIFEGSGLFGMGPSGVEHPLYKKLSTLSMGEVVTGRWDHSDPKITKTIKDYVDVWRHEQGVSYTSTETFEHYLRRVIQRILKRQTT